MAILKLALLAVVACGVFSSAYAGDVDNLGGGRKVLGWSWRPNRGGQASAGATANCFGGYWNGSKCVTITNTVTKASPRGAFSGSFSASKLGHSGAVAKGAAAASGTNAVTNTNTKTFVTPHGSGSSSHSSSKSGRK